MADVRSLLRSELAARKGSPQPGSSTNRVTKKRKVDPNDGLARKKVRHTSATPEQLLAHAQIKPPSAQAIAEDEDVELPKQDTATPEPPSIAGREADTTTSTLQPSQSPPIGLNESRTNLDTINEDEWEAFEREVAAPTRVPYRPAAVAAAATISAAPISSEELAALQEKQNETDRPNREAEVEGEREDAARFLEEEFDEMEQLEERVRRLKHKREELRIKRAMEGVETPQMNQIPSAGAAVTEQLQTAATHKNNKSEGEDENEDDGDDDDYDDDWDNWRFR